MNKLIFLALGNVAHEVMNDDLQECGLRIKPKVIVRETGFDYDYQEDSDYQPMIGALVEDRDRNQIIVNDIADESENYALVLSDRKTHLETLSNMLSGQGVEAAVLTGDVSKKRREEIIKDLDNGSLHVVLATSQLAGEGLDIPRLDRIFVTTPIKWRGRLLQYIGRGLRTAEGKTDARIYDYVDSPGILKNSFRARQRVYESLN